ncbi:MAG: PIN domain-containing protein [Moorea sp. SIO3I7]|uniref:type II toxin-antitoxin system VapC family toxin n=1 Tax=Moorena sp. SIO3I8 TaxID=2607833 RepID=UPI0013CC7996|nr:PIN domain-containing protein [Moorena sp. SIO3I8]NEN94810.1 PIN domain-containing protein [Moorena sp. SIO3I7]NEP21294.1 PIN domain-containing protein [Moorena sp. SIO3I6]
MGRKGKSLEINRVILDEALEGVKTIFLDTSPVIYYLENHAVFADVVQGVINKLDGGELQGVISPVTLAECLVNPLKNRDQKLQQDYVDFLLRHKSIRMVQIETKIGILAAQLRAKYSLKLPDGFQVATAIRSGCEALLTNDDQFRRVFDLQVLVVKDFVTGNIL